VIGLEEAIRRMTSLPATKFNLKDRGLIMAGKYADILIFDENEIQDLSVYENPHQYSKGISLVLVNGKEVLQDGKHTGLRSGVAIRSVQ
jgi:N-acyl-D-amino-acid deacylase